MTQNEFARQQQAAVERMKEMNARAQIGQNNNHKMPPVPSFVKVNENSSKTINSNPITKPYNVKQTPDNSPEATTHKVNNNSFSKNMGFPWLDSLLKDSDSTLIIGLLLILMSENSDKIMLFALIYILL